MTTLEARPLTVTRTGWHLITRRQGQDVGAEFLSTDKDAARRAIRRELGWLVGRGCNTCGRKEGKTVIWSIEPRPHCPVEDIYTLRLEWKEAQS